MKPPTLVEGFLLPGRRDAAENEKPQHYAAAFVFSCRVFARVFRQRVHSFTVVPPMRRVWRLGSCSRLEAMLEWLRELPRLEPRSQRSQMRAIGGMRKALSGGRIAWYPENGKGRA